MTSRRLAVLLMVLSAPGWAATISVSPADNLTARIEGAQPDDILLLSPGVYTPTNTGAYPFTGSFGIGKRVTVRGNGKAPGDVVLRGSPTALGDFGVYFLTYLGGTNNPSGATLENVTIDTAPGGVRIHDFINAGARLTDITLRNVVINANVAMAAGSGFGVLAVNDDRIVLDNVTVSSYQAGIELQNTNDSLVMNSKVTATAAANAPALAVMGGSGNVVVGNTFGTQKANPTVDSGYSFTGGGIVFYNTKANRFDNNVLQGFRDDGLDFTAVDLTGTLPAPQNTQNSTDNYVGKNTIVSTGLAASLPGGSAIWSNCGSDNTWLYANDASGSPEGGLTVWSSDSNMVLANKVWGHRLGVFISGGNETPPTCTVAGGAYATKPLGTYVRNNAAYFNQAEQILVRSADKNDVSMNFSSPRNGRLGSLMTPIDAANGQSGITFETDARFPSSTGFRMAGNTSSENTRGLWNRDSKPNTGIEYFLNRVMNSAYNSITTPSALNIDAGSQIGGNYWTQHAAVGNPSQGTPYSGVFQNTSNATGLVVDRYPFQTEDFGRGATVQVSEPRAGSVATGTRRTVRWSAPGCVYADLMLDGSTALATDVPNIGYAVVTMPAVAQGAHTVMVKCKNSSGAVTGQGSSPGFTLTSNLLQLMAPGRDDVLNAGSQVFVGWKKDPSITGVNVKLSVDGGATFPYTLASNVAGTFARVTLPAIASSAYAVMRVESVSPAASDTTDGVFALRGSSGAGFTNVPGSRNFVMGTVERLEWASPQGSRVVDISVNGTPIATRLPDRGYFDWFPNNLGTSTVNLSITFRQTDGTTQISTASATGTASYPVTSAPPPPPTVTRLSGISTRMQVLTGDNVLIGGFVIGGTTPKTVVVRARGPSLGVPGALADPTLTLVPASGAATVINDNWQTAANASQLAASGYAPADARESAIMMTLAPGAYTAIVSGVGGSTGVAIVEVYELDHPEVPITGIATRGYVLTGDNVMIGGFIIQGTTPKTVVVRARGPSLGVPGALADPTLTLVPASGAATVINDNWQTAANASQLAASGFAPSDARESAILITLDPGAYTAIVSGAGGTTGVAIVEVYQQ